MLKLEKWANKYFQVIFPSLFRQLINRDNKKRGQQEKERQATIQSENLIMLQHLSDIARSKRINDGNSKKIHWKDFYLQIVVNPRYV